MKSNGLLRLVALWSVMMLTVSSMFAQVEEDTLTSRHPEYLPALKVGEVAPDFTAADTLGKKISLSDYRGKYVVLDFWATWCGDCRREIPFLKELYRDVHATLIDGVPMQWLSLSFDVKEDAWKNILRKEKFPWPQISSLKSTREDPTFKAFKLNWIPAFFIIDPQGTVVGSAITAAGLRKEIEKLTAAHGVQMFNLWEKGVPSDNGLKGEERILVNHVSNVTKPTLTVYKAKNPNGLAVLACPGGGYYDVWGGSEGHNLAKWYNDMGITYAVLKYRLPNGHKEVPLDDVREAMRIMKEHEAEYGFRKLGIQGCSAGGHLAAMTSTHFANAAERPDFQILFYPVITLDPASTHRGTLDNLLGKDASAPLIAQYSNEKQVTKNTPPAFIMASSDDKVVPVSNSVSYYNALVSNGVQATMHLYPTGGHGWCGNSRWYYREQWMSELKAWLLSQQQ